MADRNNSFPNFAERFVIESKNEKSTQTQTNWYKNEEIQTESNSEIISKLERKIKELEKTVASQKKNYDKLEKEKNGWKQKVEQNESQLRSEVRESSQNFTEQVLNTDEDKALRIINSFIATITGKTTKGKMDELRKETRVGVFGVQIGKLKEMLKTKPLPNVRKYLEIYLPNMEDCKEYFFQEAQKECDKCCEYKGKDREFMKFCVQCEKNN